MPLSITSERISDFPLMKLEIAGVKALYTSKAFFPPSTIQIDPWHRWKFNRLLYGYVEEKNIYKLVIRLYFPSRYLSSTGNDYLPLAKKIMELSLKFYILGAVNLGLTPRWSKEGIVDIWLSENGNYAGEQIGKDLYIYQIAKERSELELLREIAHEWGHHIIPPIGPYTAPEEWANGVIGERLLLKLYSSTLPASEERTKIIKFLEEKNEKPIEIFLKEGYPSETIGDKSEKGFWYLVGLVLAKEQEKGITYLGKAFQRLKDQQSFSPGEVAKVLMNE
ncbi:hypothetical protein H5T87_08930 [bacterium]|nr:hypothetical protein [bacterium]